MAEYTSLIYRVEQRIARLTLNRPEKRNALSATLRDEIVDALHTAERDDEVRIVLIDGAGPSFCSGYDITPDGSGRPTEYVSRRWFDGWTDQFTRSCVRDWLTIWDLLKPVVAMVHGHCVAGGTEIMSMCDIAFVADDAVIGYPPMRGMTTPDTLYFAWKMPMARAKYLQLTGNSISGKQAAEWGWVAKSFAPDQLERETLRELQAMASISPDLLAANKLSLNQTYEIMGFRTSLNTAAQWHALSGQLRPGAGEFGRIAREQGLRAALDWRDRPFREAGL
ncbi:MAG TPA: enoyl-CoA hydratase-related protein [Dehalococcoidia bacterium]